MAKSKFNYEAKKAMFCSEPEGTSGMMLTTGTTSELYNDIVAFQDFYGIQYNFFLSGKDIKTDR